MHATQHTAAFWEYRFLDAARYAEDGLRYATTGSARAFLASAQALDLAKAGQADDARTALARARDVTEAVAQACDELAGPFTCQVRAHLALSQLDGAQETLAPVLDTGPEYRVRPLMQRLGEVHTQVATCKQRDEPMLCAMREAITVFQKQAVVA